MNKNIIIGVLAALLVLTGVLAVFWNRPVNQNPTAPTDTTVTTPTPTQSQSVSVPAAPTLSPTIGSGSDVVVSNSTALLTGQVTPNGAPTTYWYEYGQTESLGSRTASQAIGSGFYTVYTPTYITGLRASTIYYYRLLAQNRFSTVQSQIYSFQTNNTPLPVFYPPTVHTSSATEITRMTAILHGEVNPKGTATSYWYEYGQSPDFGNTSPLHSVGNGTALINTSLPIANLAPQTKYYFRLNAQNPYGTVIGSTLSFTTQGPPNSAPSVVTTSTSDINSTSATLKGRITPNGADTTYWFEYSLNPLTNDTVGTLTSTQSLTGGSNTTNVSASINGLNRNTKYYFRLVGKNNNGMIRGNTLSFRTDR